MPAVTLTPLEVKLLHLILNKNAAEGEVNTGSVKLVQSLRNRGVDAEAIENALAKEPLAIKPLRPDPGLTPMAWGKHRGKIIADVPPSVLRNAISWARRTPGVAEKFATFIADAEQFLQQGKN